MKKFFLGLVAGIAAGMLFAPESGKKLRNRLQSSRAKLSDMGNILLEAAKDAHHEVQHFLNRDDVKKWISEGKKSLGEFGAMIEEKSVTLSLGAKKELQHLLSSALEAAESALPRVKKAITFPRKKK